MKNKAFTYSLLIVVAIIWYQVFFRVKGNIFGEDEVLIQANAPKHDLPSLARDTVILDLNYRDPFGITKRKPTSFSLDANPNNISRPKVRQAKPQLIWPVIKYYGMLQKTYSNKPLGIITVDGIQLMLRKGEEVFDGIYIVKIERDVITVRYKKETKEVFK